MRNKVTIELVLNDGFTVDDVMEWLNGNPTSTGDGPFRKSFSLDDLCASENGAVRLWVKKGGK